ncbi:hypothetical protein FZ103_01275 [Streptomonospora sp. PA3]|uniref:hypothetical protein n=1 Tax=Streptomonospora sp. PA3 TaxID=2607326 RepID=UPI00130C8598|nr:hypothetical protein [Streptomonospora sp. PA3]MUL39822.1 hypothetical protein [Streptomonospora sp. PA3]
MSPIIIVLIALAAGAVLAGVAFAVMGKGGELARFEADHPPLDLPADRPLSGSDVSRVLLPLSLWGYHVRAVDDVLRRVVGALSERDARIADLERRLAEAGQAVPPASPGTAASSGPQGAASADPAGSAGAAAPVRTGAHTRGAASPGTPRAADRPRGGSGSRPAATGGTGADKPGDTAAENDRSAGGSAGKPSGSSDDADGESDPAAGADSADSGRESAAAGHRQGAR